MFIKSWQGGSIVSGFVLSCTKVKHRSSQISLRARSKWQGRYFTLLTSVKTSFMRCATWEMPFTPTKETFIYYVIWERYYVFISAARKKYTQPRRRVYEKGTVLGILSRTSFSARAWTLLWILQIKIYNKSGASLKDKKEICSCNLTFLLRKIISDYAATFFY